VKPQPLTTAARVGDYTFGRFLHGGYVNYDCYLSIDEDIHGDIHGALTTCCIGPDRNDIQHDPDPCEPRPTADCDCCGREVFADMLSHGVAYGTDTSACPECCS
jgi:hypothetical protein